MRIDDRIRILVLDSGGGYGGPGSFLRYFLGNLDRDRFAPCAAFYRKHEAPETEALRAMGIPVLFLSEHGELATYVQLRFLANETRWKWLNLLRAALRFALQFVLLEVFQLWKLVRLLKQRRFDLILLNNDVHFHRVGALAARMTGIPCICRKSGGVGEGKRIKRLLTPWVDLFIAVSRATAADQIERNPETRKLVTIYEGVDFGSLTRKSSPLEMKRALSIPPDKRVVGCIARIVEGKGQREFIEAAALISKKCSDVVFLVVGDTGPAPVSLLKELQTRAVELGLEKQVIFAGWRTDIPDILSTLDVFVHCPTTWIEALGIAHIEAMASGKPAVVSNNGGLPDAALDCVTGFVVPPADAQAIASAVLRLLGDPPLARRMGRHAKRRAQELFDMQKNTKKLEEVFEKCARKNLLAPAPQVSRIVASDVCNAPAPLPEPQGTHVVRS